jgi:hypothetical protein
MSETPNLTPARRAEHAARDKRLAEALRENLRRRKEQARARDDSPAPRDREPEDRKLDYRGLEDRQGDAANPRG